jgi:hypothetical protein
MKSIDASAISSEIGRTTHRSHGKYFWMTGATEEASWHHKQTQFNI